MQFRGRPTRAARRPRVLVTAALLSAALIAAAFVPVAVDTPTHLGADSAAASMADDRAAAPPRPVQVPLPTPTTTPEPAAPATRGGVPPTGLHLVKLMDNRGGGTASESDWTLTATAAAGTAGATNLAGTTPVDSGPGFQPGVYMLGETYTGSDPATAAAYRASAWRCADTGTGREAPVTPAGAVTVNQGDDITCTITNVYIPPVVTPEVCTLSITGHKRYVARVGPLAGEQVGLSGWRITATLVGREELSVSTTTDALGAYVFTREMLGPLGFGGATIRVCEESRPGWRNLAPACSLVYLPNPLPMAYCVPVVDFVNAQTSPVYGD